MNEIELPPYVWLLVTAAMCLLVFPNLDKKKHAHRAMVSAATITAVLTYLYWRVSGTLDFSDSILAVLSLSFFVLEIASCLGEILVMWVLTRYRDRSHDVARNLEWVATSQPNVAIFICTYNEDVGILERTIIGAQSQTYPTRIYLLDDGNRPEVASLCKRCGVEWITRDDNRHAKAGNMNAAISNIAARGELPEFIAILDADFVALPQFIKRSLALFRDPRIGVVQTPQHFFNPDPLQHRIRAHLDLPDEQRFFFDTLLPAKDAWGTAFSCGTSSVIRTSALSSIGGFPTDSVTEDMLLSIRMKSHGYITAYLNERLSLGLAPEGVGEYTTQRVRWCVGAMQIVRGSDGIFSRSGLTLLDRLSQLDTLLYWAGSFPFRLACLIWPVVYWFTGLTVMEATVAELTIFLAPRLVIEAFAIAWFSNGRIMPLLTDVQQLLIAPEIIVASLHTLLFPGERPFKVTNKGGDRSRTLVHWKILCRFGVILLLTSVGMIFSYAFPLMPTFFSEQKGVVAIWSGYNVLVCVVAIIVCVETPRRVNERVALSGKAIFRSSTDVRLVTLVDISSNGVAFQNDGGWAIGDKGTISIQELGLVEATIARVSDDIVGARIALSPEQLISLTTLQFDEQHMRMPNVSTLNSFLALVRGLIGK